MSIVLFSDSLCDLSKELIKKIDVKIIPLWVSFEGDERVYHDGVDIDVNTIYERVKETGVLPKTSACSPQVFYETFKEELDKGNQVFYVGTGSGLSTTFQNAHIAKSELNNPNLVIADSKTLSTGIGLLLIKARQYINEQKSIDEIKTLIEDHVEKNSVKFSIDIMDYLYKGGRCGGISFLFGKLLHIHPIIKVIDNKLHVYKKPRGKYEKALDEQINELIEELDNIDTSCVFITHSGPDDSTDPEYVFEKIKQYIPEENIHITRAGSTVSCHCGPRTLGILYLLKEKPLD